MGDEYKGESPAKKFSRIRYWDNVSLILGEKFRSGLHVVLASREAGDISCLLGMRVDPENILAVDRRRDAVESARGRFPEANYRVGDIGDVSRDLPRKASSVYLDFCSTFNEGVEETLRKVIPSLAAESCLGITVLAGRERGGTRDDYVKHQAERALDRAISFSGTSDQEPGVFDGEFEFGTEEAKKVFGEVVRRVFRGAERSNLTRAEMAESGSVAPPQDGTEACRDRFTYVLEKVHGIASGLGVGIVPRGVSYYVSNTKEARGAPMLTVTFRIIRFKPAPESPEEFDTLLSDLINREDENGLNELDRMDEFFPVADHSSVVSFVSKHPDSRVHLLVNAPSAHSVAGWKAHLTNNRTYKPVSFPNPYVCLQERQSSDAFWDGEEFKLVLGLRQMRVDSWREVGRSGIVVPFRNGTRDKRGRHRVVHDRAYWLREREEEEETGVQNAKRRVHFEFMDRFGDVFMRMWTEDWNK